MKNYYIVRQATIPFLSALAIFSSLTAPLKAEVTEPLPETEVPQVQEPVPLDSPELEQSLVLPQNLTQSASLLHPEPIQEDASTAIAQSVDPSGSGTIDGGPSLRTEPQSPEEKPFQPKQVPLTQVFQVTPSITFLTPSAFGKSWGQASVGLGFQSRARFSERADAVLGVGMGFGDARKNLGVDASYTSSSTFRRTPFTGGSFSLKLHRRLSNDLAVATGAQSLIRYGETDSVISPYAVVTKVFRLKEDVQQPLSQVYVSTGVGAGQFEWDVDDKLESVGLFGSVAVRVIEPVNFITEWSGQDLTLGVSVTPFRNIPFVITPAVTDITGRAGDGARFVLGVGYGISF